MNNFNQNYHYSQKQIDILLTQIQNQLQEQYQDLTVRWRTSKYNSRFRIKEPFRIDIGTKCIFDNLHQEYVRDQDFVKVIFALNHEERHLQQRLLFQSTDVSDEIKISKPTRLLNYFILFPCHSHTDSLTLSCYQTLHLILCHALIALHREIPFLWISPYLQSIQSDSDNTYDTPDLIKISL